MINAEKLGFNTRADGVIRYFYKKIFGRFALLEIKKLRDSYFKFKCGNGESNSRKVFFISLYIGKTYYRIDFFKSKDVLIFGNFPLEPLCIFNKDKEAVK